MNIEDDECGQSKVSRALLWLCLVREIFFYSVTLDASQGCREGFSILIKKLHNMSGNSETNLMILINLSLADVGYCST
jgi:hypothetical protein